MIDKIFYVLQGGCGNILHCFMCEKSLMRSDDYIVEREQTGEYIIVDNAVGLIFIKVFAFFLVYVQSCGTYFLVFQPFNQRIGMNPVSYTHLCFSNSENGTLVDASLQDNKIV